MNNPEYVTASDLPKLLDRHPDLELLTVDCFDTLVHRSVAAPVDVFHILESHDLWRENGITAALRQIGEAEARQRKFAKTGKSEVTLEEIYLSIDPSFDDEDAQHFASLEVEVERQVCAPFGPVVELIRKALEKGIRVAIASDTYLDAAQLRTVAGGFGLGGDGVELSVFTSADHGMSKAERLLVKIAGGHRLGEGAEPSRVLHIGDSYAADVAPALAAGFHAVQFVKLDARVAARERSAEQALLALSHHVRSPPRVGDCDPPCRALYAPQRRVFATTDRPFKSREELVGYTVVGPIVHAFAQAVLNMAMDQYRCERDHDNRGLVPAFLMRDAWLVRRACTILADGPPGGRGEPDALGHDDPERREELPGLGRPDYGDELEVSRFAATAAAFVEEADVWRYLARVTPGVRLDAYARQLGFECPPIPGDPGSILAFRKEVEGRIDRILEWSAEQRRRLGLYLDRQLGGRENLRLLVDLGYTGTVERALRRAGLMGPDVRSLYMLALPVVGPARDKRGSVIGGDNDDDVRLVAALTRYVAPLEIWCSSGQPSAVGYDAEGNPEHDPDRTMPSMRDSARRVQSAALQFVIDAQREGLELDWDQIRQTIVGRLGALEYLPGIEEVQLMQQMALDVNLGTEHAVPVIDIERSTRQLYRRGFSYLSAQQGRTMLQGAEARFHGIELSLAWMNALRSGMTVTHADLSLKRHSVVVSAVAGGVETVATSIECLPTYDGFFAAEVPNASDEPAKFRFHLGPHLEYASIEAATTCPIGAARSQEEERMSSPVQSSGIKGAELAAQGLLKFEPTGHVWLIAPPRHVAKLVFRPVAVRRPVDTTKQPDDAAVMDQAAPETES